MTSSTSPLASKAVLVVMFAALLAMFAWSFAYRAANPSLIATVQQSSGPPPEMGMQGGNAMNTVMAAMSKLQKNPDDLEAVTEAAEAFAAAEIWDKALQLLERAAAKAPDNPEILNLQGVALFRLERPKDAAAKFQRMLELDPGNYRAQYNLAAVYKHGLSEPAKAKALFEAVLANPGADPLTRHQAEDELRSGS
ncbi:tetratricopeptide repeat protein [Fundidesulfovibrio soli]|uniref:tetratricopeptide repeat protein n=1 Tax=Fundidesulfovibrio soli TaxID=2922716 RepID=UPI001FAFA174|nr:tetratricopeptide repeat protein [Fundidesulfovibrio soli]